MKKHNEAIQTSISKLENLHQSLYQTFASVEAERKKLNRSYQKLKSVHFEYGYSSSEYEAVNKQFLDHATNYLGK